MKHRGGFPEIQTGLRSVLLLLLLAPSGRTYGEFWDYLKPHREELRQLATSQGTWFRRGRLTLPFLLQHLQDEAPERRAGATSLIRDLAFSPSYRPESPLQVKQVFEKLREMWRDPAPRVRMVALQASVDWSIRHHENDALAVLKELPGLFVLPDPLLRSTILEFFESPFCSDGFLIENSEVSRAMTQTIERILSGTQERSLRQQLLYHLRRCAEVHQSRTALEMLIRFKSEASPPVLSGIEELKRKLLNGDETTPR